MRKFTTLFFILLTTPLVLADGQFCYRNSENALICRSSLDAIPKLYKNKVFYREDTSSNNKPKKHTTKSSNDLTTSNNSKTSQGNNNTNLKKSDITIFVADWCPHCRALEQFLSREGLSYKKIDVDKDPYGQKVFREENGSIPITKINGSTIIGFNEVKFKEIIDAKKPY